MVKVGSLLSCTSELAHLIKQKQRREVRIRVKIGVRRTESRNEIGTGSSRGGDDGAEG